MDTPAWFAWLTTATRFSYIDHYPLYRLTARKEKRRHRWYWYAYAKYEAKLHNAYLGKSDRVTLARLSAISVQLAHKAKRQ